MIRDTYVSNDVLDSHITNIIYSICKKSYKERTKKIELLPELANCNSRNYKAISQINLYTYHTLIERGVSFDLCKTYLEVATKYEELARHKENEEINVQINTAWKNAKADGKKLWSLIDWKGNAESNDSPLKIRESEIYKHFKNIFQSDKTRQHPMIKDVKQQLDEYNKVIPFMDELPKKDEVDFAVRNIGKGVGVDGLPGNILKMLPNNMKDIVLILMKNVVAGKYPNEWEKQILHALPKPGHTIKTPKLRGIAISTLMAKVYDCIINQRFKAWYTPNREEAGFRDGQGCAFQIFILVLLISYEKEKKKDLMVGFMDYEKAFDYAYRSNIILDLMKKDCGKKFTTAIAKIYNSTAYIPEVGRNRLGNEIVTGTGVAQGRKSSANLYSFYVSDMPSCMENMGSDFMDPFNVVQLADDTILLAENKESLIMKFRAAFAYSEEKYQVPNLTKTVYGHFACNPSTDTITIKNNIRIESINKTDGYKYFGETFIPTDDMNEIVIKNINERVGNICKFYAWVEINETTPIEIKLLVLQSCFFNSILCGIEAWGNIGCVEQNVV